jgi:hypothetical protein
MGEKAAVSAAGCCTASNADVASRKAAYVVVVYVYVQ